MRTALWIILVIALSGCGSLKEWRENRKEKNDTTNVVTNTTNTETVTVVTETVDTNVVIPGDSAKIVTPLDNLLTGDTIKTENNGTSIAVVYNPQTGQVTAIGRTPERNVPIKIDKKTETRGTTASRTDSKSSSSSKEVVRASRKEKQLSKGKFWWGFAFAIFVLLILVILFLVGRGYLKRFIPPKI